MTTVSCGWRSGLPGAVMDTSRRPPRSARAQRFRCLRRSRRSEGCRRRGPRGRAKRNRMIIRKACPLGGQLIQNGKTDLGFLPVRRQVSPAVIIRHDEQNVESVGTTCVTKGKEKKNEVKEFNMIKFCFHAFEKMGCTKQLGSSF